jgi:hypothetical protein
MALGPLWAETQSLDKETQGLVDLAAPHHARRFDNADIRRRARWPEPALQGNDGGNAPQSVTRLDRAVAVIATPGLWDPGGSNPGNVGRLTIPGSPRRHSPSKDGRLSTPYGSSR